MSSCEKSDSSAVEVSDLERVRSWFVDGSLKNPTEGPFNSVELIRALTSALGMFVYTSFFFWGSLFDLMLHRRLF